MIEGLNELVVNEKDKKSGTERDNDVKHGNQYELLKIVKAEFLKKVDTGLSFNTGMKTVDTDLSYEQEMKTNVADSRTNNDSLQTNTDNNVYFRAPVSETFNITDYTDFRSAGFSEEELVKLNDMMAQSPAREENYVTTTSPLSDSVKEETAESITAALIDLYEEKRYRLISKVHIKSPPSDRQC